MTHLDLFSGIGGFSIASDSVFGNVEHVFCDNDEYCREVVKRHWPESKVYDDIKSITEPIRADLVTGGFPCQPFSAVGARLGTADERHLWPEMLRVIRLSQPSWVIAENVRGILTWNDGLVFEQVCSDLEDNGYEVQAYVIPAVAVNAPHRRDRVWFVANRHGARLEEARAEQQTAGFGRDSFDEDWQAVAARLLRMDYGISGKMGDTTLTPARHRKEQLKAYGNAIVPQVAIQIMKSIKLTQGVTTCG